MAVAAAIISGTAALASLGMQAYGMHQSYLAGEAAKDAAEVTATAAKAQIDTQIEGLEETSERDIELLQEQGNANIGAAAAAYGASGVRVTEGSPLDELMKRKTQLVEDVDYLRSTAARDIDALKEQKKFVGEGGEYTQLALGYNQVASTFLGGSQLAMSAGNWGMDMYGFGQGQGWWGS